MNVREYKQWKPYYITPWKKKARKKKEALLGWRRGGLEIPGAWPKVVWEEKCIADDRTQGWAYRK